MVDHIVGGSIIEPRVKFVNDRLETDDGEKTRTKT